MLSTILFLLPGLAVASTLSPSHSYSDDCTIYGYPQSCSSTCSIIFDQTNACADSDSDATCRCQIPTKDSLAALGCESCIAQKANKTLTGYKQTLEEIRDIIEVCGSADAVTGTGALTTSTGVPVTAGQTRITASWGIIGGAMAIAAIFI